MPKLEPKLKIISRLHVFRAEARISQEELAKAIDVTRGTIVAIEGGEYNPSLELAFRLARYFNTDIQSIFSIEEDADEKSK
jgi:putative transcriptional regulator